MTKETSALPPTSRSLTLSLPPLFVALMAGTATAQDVNEEVRRATELAISGSIGEALSESLDRSVELRDATSDAADTFYSQGAYGWLAEGSDGFSGGVDFDVTSYRALAGTTASFTDRLFGGLAVSATNVTTEVSFDNGLFSFDEEFSFNFYTLAGNAAYFLFRNQRSRLWGNGLYQFTYIDIDDDTIDDSYSNSISPGLNYAIDFEPMTVELSGGATYSTNSESSDDYTNAQTGVKFKTDINDFVPQLLLSYSKGLNSGNDQGTVSIRPEVNYRQDNLVFGIGYSHSRQVEDDLLRQNEAFVNLRWRF